MTAEWHERGRQIHRPRGIGGRIADLLGVEVQVEEHLVHVGMRKEREVIVNLLDAAMQRFAVGVVDRRVAQAGDAAYDTSHDYSVGITKIPRYGLGCWPDVKGAAGQTPVVSGNGGKGLYPWVDFTTRTWGIVGVQDERGAQVAVPASLVVEVEARTAVARP